MASYQEKRECDRTKFIADVTIVCDGEEVVAQAELRDISIVGLFVEAQHEVPVGSSCEIIITINAKNSRLTLDNIFGEVTRVSSSGLALRFTSNMEWFVLFKIYTHYSKGG